MALGFKSGGGFGLKARVEAQVDNQAKRQITRDVETAIEDAEQSVSPNARGFRGRTTPSAGGGGGGAGAGFLAGAIGGGGLLKVALGGIVGFGLLKGVERMARSLSKASPALSGTFDILKEGFKLYMKPFGDLIADALLPHAKAFLKGGIEFHNLAKEEGIGVAIKSVAEGAFDFLFPRVSTPLFGTIELSKMLKDKMEDWETSDWETVIQSVTLGSFVTGVALADFVSSVNLGDFVKPLTDWVGGSGPLPTITRGGLLSALFPFSLTAQMIIDALIKDEPTGETPSTSTSGGASSRSTHGGSRATVTGPSGDTVETNVPASDRVMGGEAGAIITRETEGIAGGGRGGGGLMDAPPGATGRQLNITVDTDALQRDVDESRNRFDSSILQP